MSHNRDLSAAAAQIGFHSSNIGIGTDAPSETITLNHANGASIGLEYDGTENGTINVNSAAMYARAGSGKHLILGGNATESLRLTSGGDIGIANASPRAKLDIEDAGTSKDVILRVSADDTNPYALVVANDTFNTTSNRGFAFWVGGNKVHHIEARTSTTNSENEIMISAGDAITFRTNVSEERFRINGDGNIGIGDASPTKPLTVGTTTPVILLDDQSSRTLEIRGPSTTHIASILTTSGHSLLLGTNNSERLRIDSNGKIHVGGNGTGTDQFNLIAAGGGINIARMNSGDANVNEWLGALGFKGYATGNSSSGADARIHANAAFNHSGTSAPANLIFSTKGTTQGPGSSPLERMRITYDGKLGIGHAAGSQIAKELTIRPVNDGGIRFVRPGDNAGSPNIHLDLTTTTSGSVFPSGEAYTVKYNTYNNDQIFTTYVGGGTGGNISFKTATQGNTPAERFRIDSSGRVTIPDQPGCKISIDSNSQGGGNQTQTGRTILPFNSTAYGYNTGNHYNLTTHTFTCPLNGKYLVILSVNIIGDNIAYIYKNGSIHSAGEFRSNPTNVWEHMEVSTVVDCSANDTIQPYSQLISGKKFNGGSGGSYWDTFTIYFLG